MAWVDSTQVQVLAKDVGHFDVYMGAAFEEVVAEQLSFLQVRLHSHWKTGKCFVNSSLQNERLTHAEKLAQSADACFVLYLQRCQRHEDKTSTLSAC